MAKFGTFRDGFFELNGTEVSDHCESFTPTHTIKANPLQALGDTNEYSNPGLRKDALAARFYNDQAAGSIHRILEDLYRNRRTFGIKYRHDKSAAVSINNPTVSGQWFITSVGGLDGGKLGDNSMVDVTFEPAGNGLTYTTS